MAVVELNVKAKREQPPPPEIKPSKGGIKLEKGKSYYSREGVVVGPMCEWNMAFHKGRPVLACFNTGYVFFADDGTYVGREHVPDYPMHLFSEVWAYEKEEKAWKNGATLEYSDPKGIVSPVGEWKELGSYQTLSNFWGGKWADNLLRDSKELLFRIKE